MKNNNGFSFIELLAVLVLLGILLIINPFQGAKKIVQILGISILVYSLLDLIDLEQVIASKTELENYILLVSKIPPSPPDNNFLP